MAETQNNFQNSTEIRERQPTAPVWLIQNRLDDMMGWKRGWRDEPINKQTMKERLAYLYSPDDCEDNPELKMRCRELYYEFSENLRKE